MNEKSLSIYDWKEYMEEHHFTVGDLKNLKKNESIRLLFIDAYFHEYLEKENKKNLIKNPYNFFSNNSFGTYTHNSNFNGTIIWEYPNAPYEIRDFQFNILYSGNIWDKINIDINDLNDSILVGIDGPVLPFSCLENSPNIFIE